MCSPLHIRAPTRPLILQCVTEPLSAKLSSGSYLYCELRKCSTKASSSSLRASFGNDHATQELNGNCSVFSAFLPIAGGVRLRAGKSARRLRMRRFITLTFWGSTSICMRATKR
jgi:hypothetical protein